MNMFTVIVSTLIVGLLGWNLMGVPDLLPVEPESLTAAPEVVNYEGPGLIEVRSDGLVVIVDDQLAWLLASPDFAERFEAGTAWKGDVIVEQVGDTYSVTIATDDTAIEFTATATSSGFDDASETSEGYGIGTPINSPPGGSIKDCPGGSCFCELTQGDGTTCSATACCKKGESPRCSCSPLLGCDGDCLIVKSVSVPGETGP